MTRRARSAAGYGLILLLLQGCASSEGVFETKRDPEYHEKLSGVLLLHTQTDAAKALGGDYMDKVLVQLTQLLENKSVPADRLILAKVELDRSAAIKAVLEKSHPKQVLEIAVKRVNEYRHAMLPPSSMAYDTVSSSQSLDNTTTSFRTLTLAFALTDLSSKKVVWRGEVAFETVPDSENVAKQLFEQMVSAGFL